MISTNISARSPWRIRTGVMARVQTGAQLTRSPSLMHFSDPRIAMLSAANGASTVISAEVAVASSISRRLLPSKLEGEDRVSDGER